MIGNLYVMPYVPLALGTVLALLVTFGSKSVTRPRAVSISGGVGALLGLALLFTPIVWPSTRLLWQQWSPSDPLAGTWIHYALPLIGGTIAIAITALGYLPSRMRGQADLKPKRSLTYVSRSQLVLVALLTAVILVITVITGLASSPMESDEKERYAWYVIHVGSGGGGSEFYGWYQSVPTMIALVVLLCVTCLSILFITRRPAVTGESDARRRSTRAILLIATAALILHLFHILEIIRSVAKTHMEFPSGEGWVIIESPLAQSGVALLWLGYLLQAAAAYCVARAFWLSVLRTRTPISSRER